jgi:hypothetical protein
MAHGWMILTQLCWRNEAQCVPFTLRTTDSSSATAELDIAAAEPQPSTQSG